MLWHIADLLIGPKRQHDPAVDTGCVRFNQLTNLINNMHYNRDWPSPCCQVLSYTLYSHLEQNKFVFISPRLLSLPGCNPIHTVVVKSSTS
jgi:hypothetical protein